MKLKITPNHELIKSLGLDPDAANVLIQHTAEEVCKALSVPAPRGRVLEDPPFEDAHTNDRERELYESGMEVLSKLQERVVRIFGLEKEYARVIRQRKSETVSRAV